MCVIQNLVPFRMFYGSFYSGWALTFPNGEQLKRSLSHFSYLMRQFFSVGWIATLRVLGDIFDIKGFFIVHLIFAILMCLTWTILFVLTVMAFWKGLIFRSKEEDVLNDSVVPPYKEKPSYSGSMA